MLYGLYASGLGALGQSMKMDIIANNLANVNTPGFRRDRVSFRERLTEALEDFPDLKYYNSMVHRYGGAPYIDGIHFDKEPGGFEASGHALDLAINGKGYFVLRDMNTNQFFYSRAGNFILDSEGRVITPDGQYQLVAEDGSGLSIDPGSLETQIIVDTDGFVFQGNEARGRMRVVEFADEEGLRKFGDNLFENAATETVEPRGFQVVQGSLESSSVNPIAEMVEMIKAIRAVDSNLQMVRIQDSTLDRAVNDFGRVPR